jgi:hypothetical protein
MERITFIYCGVCVHLMFIAAECGFLICLCVYTRVPICPIFPGTDPFFHIMSRCPGFILDVPLFKLSSVTLTSLDNHSV